MIQKNMYYKMIILLNILFVLNISCEPSEDSNTDTKIKENNYFPGQVIPNNFGVNTHLYSFTETSLELLSGLGVSWVRTDLQWETVELEKGNYDFSSYDLFTEKMNENNIGIIFILDYGNPLYEDYCGISTSAGREAFANFSKAATTYFKDYNIIWEIWNEPDAPDFWQPYPNAYDYFLLAKETYNAIKVINPDACVVAPALGKFDFTFLGELFEYGLLDYVDGLSIHFYGDYWPEVVDGHIKTVREMMAIYDYPDMPLICSEWGYGAVYPIPDDIDMPAYGITEEIWGFTELNFDFILEIQGAYMVRSLLVNFINDIKISICYSWKDDGYDESIVDHNYGLVDAEDNLKPVYNYIKTMLTNLNGLHFSKKVESVETDWILKFTNDNKEVIVAWTTDVPHDISINGHTYLINGIPIYIVI